MIALDTPVLKPTRASRSALTVEQVAGQSAATVAWAENPLKLLVPRSRGVAVWACLSSFGGGMVAGDQTRLDACIGPGARCFLGTQSSTKVYRNPQKLPCTHRVRATVGTGGLLVMAPDPVQCFADAIYDQNQTFHLEPGAGMVVLDWFCSGRVARGERWVFSRYTTRTEVSVGGKLVLLDALRLSPDDGPLASSLRTGRCDCLATLILIGEPLRPAVRALLDHFASAPVQKRASLLCAASALPGGVLLRVAGLNTEAVAHTIWPHLSFLREWLGDDPWARKW